MRAVQRQAIIDSACAQVENDRQRMMDILIEVQRQLRCVDGAAMDQIAERVGCSRVEVEGVASFYAFFSKERKGDICIRLCDDIVDRHAGMPKVAAAFERELGIDMGQTDENGAFSLDWTPCIGMCDQAPAVLINDIVFTRLTPARVIDLVADIKAGADPVTLVGDPGDGNNLQPSIVSEVHNNIRQTGEVLLGEVVEGAGLKNALNKQPSEIIDCLDSADLRGRGGAGFPTARKWRLCAETEADRRYVICNADEGEPGTFKDRVLLTERAELLIEGMCIAARAIGADSGIIYLRGEYSYLQVYLQQVLDQRRSSKLLGKNICSVTGYDFDIRIQMGAGAYICGEESALISSCEGLRGEPKTRPPFPVQRGYLGKPTIVNNVETFCCVARILDRGADWFQGLGTKQSSGTKLLSISGDCQRPGVYEVPFGVTVNQVLELARAEDAAAVLMGGPSGELINQGAFTRQICFEDLATGGAMVIFNSRRNILEIVSYYLDFFVEESCGYCTPCRVGNVFLKERIDKIRRGLAVASDLDYLRELGNTIIATSRCGLGQTSPHPVLSSMKNFPLVYSALIKDEQNGLQAGFDIQQALEESRRLAKRRSFIYDPSYSDVEAGSND